MHGCVKVPRRNKEVTAVQDYLNALGAVLGMVRQNAHVRIPYEVAGRAHVVVIPSSPRCAENAVRCAKQQIRRALRADGLEVQA